MLVSDWSSDVCSSDLGTEGPRRDGSAEASGPRARARRSVPLVAHRSRRRHGVQDLPVIRQRSEERRVGKEWRSRSKWSRLKYTACAKVKAMVVGWLDV